jgi:hypothetical protein
MLYSYNGNYPTALPFVISLPNGAFRFDPVTFTEEEIASAGYVLAEDPPTEVTSNQRLTWETDKWVITELPEPPLPTLD